MGNNHEFLSEGSAMTTRTSRPSRLEPLFGININPNAGGVKVAFDMARFADQSGIDLIGIQDHPYNGGFLDTWTLLSALGAATSNIRLFPNVANLPLRPPAMLAKAAASLDIITGGRVVLGLGTGAFWEGVAAYGGPRRTPGEAFQALEEAIQIMRLVWGSPGNESTVSFAGKHYSLVEAQPGPRPSHSIDIWLGAIKPRMLRLIGRLADGWSVSLPYVPPEQIPESQRLIDEAAQEASRDAGAIRRNYNLGGMIQQTSQSTIRARRPGILFGSVSTWVETLVRFYTELGMDTFNFWPVAGNELEQIRLFAQEVVPAAREQIEAVRTHSHRDKTG
jgi:alkanesulfonate monooxygenase SsuD/methylene tetrahydromethanopterin reductase-like flavin-dependent oxidoreductase (luciferase family)